MAKKEIDKTTIIVAMISGFFGLMTSTTTILLSFYLNKTEEVLERPMTLQSPSAIPQSRVAEETLEFLSLNNSVFLFVSFIMATLIGLFLLWAIRRLKK